MGFVELLALIFVMAKLFGFITWSWWIVFLPEIIVMFIYLIVLTSPLWIDKYFERDLKK